MRNTRPESMLLSHIYLYTHLHLLSHALTYTYIHIHTRIHICLHTLTYKYTNIHLTIPATLSFIHKIIFLIRNKKKHKILKDLHIIMYFTISTIHNKKIYLNIPLKNSWHFTLFLNRIKSRLFKSLQDRT